MGDFTQASVTQALATRASATQVWAILVSLSINKEMKNSSLGCFFTCHKGKNEREENT
jgi:hypothetical protein